MIKSFLKCLVFSESEKRVSDKKPAGTVSPPTGSPTPAAPPSSIRTAYLPYNLAFNVLLQCLKMVHKHTHS